MVTPENEPADLIGALPNISSTTPLSQKNPPLHQVVKQQISDAILVGKWPAGTVLPNEIELARMFGVAVGTLRRALADLTKEGLLTRRRKTGTIVTGRQPQQSLRFFFRYFRLHDAAGHLQNSKSRILKLETRPGTAEECDALQEAEGTKVICIDRIRSVDGKPIMFDVLRMAARRLPDFFTDPTQIPSRLYLHFLEKYGIRISAIREQLSAELASEEDRKLLDISAPTAALLCIDEIAYDQAGAPLVYATHRCRTENHRYVNEVQ